MDLKYIEWLYFSEKKRIEFLSGDIKNSKKGRYPYKKEAGRTITVDSSPPHYLSKLTPENEMGHDVTEEKIVRPHYQGKWLWQSPGFGHVQQIVRCGVPLVCHRMINLRTCLFYRNKTSWEHIRLRYLDPRMMQFEFVNVPQDKSNQKSLTDPKIRHILVNIYGNSIIQGERSGIHAQRDPSNME